MLFCASVPKWVQGCKHGSVDGISSVLQWGHVWNHPILQHPFLPFVYFLFTIIDALNHLFYIQINFPSLDNYDEDQAWPLILDNFVEWLRANKK